MDQKCDRLYPTAPLESFDLEQRLEKKLNDVNSFNNSINNIKEMITYFKDKNHNSKKRYKNYKTLNTVLESVDSIMIIGATSTSITLSIIGIGLIILPISAGVACTLSLGDKLLHKLIINKYNKNKNNMKETNKQLNLLINYPENLYKIIWSIKLNMKVHVIFLLKILMKTKMNLFYKHEDKKKIKLF